MLKKVETEEELLAAMDGVKRNLYKWAKLDARYKSLSHNVAIDIVHVSGWKDEC